jgi:hypothetical protein
VKPPNGVVLFEEAEGWIPSSSSETAARRMIFLRILRGSLSSSMQLGCGATAKENVAMVVIVTDFC